ncbi:YebC/PmpR family DNA-binding transcriptional regulator [bacterium]|nr:YebC/PmpR family DNA-binding transcriptional regulator [candidate division CSSED10-310 bacterium]
MSGHSKWHSIKHKKAAADAKRGRTFTKIIKEITVAARFGGGDPDMNPRLRLAVNNAKAANMPADNIARAIKKGTGELPGVSYEEATYEGYGPGGVAVIVEVLTDNKNRSVSEVRHVFSRSGGNLGSNGCVAFMFKKKGLITVNAEGINEDDLMMLVLDAGAEDLTSEDDTFEIVTELSDFDTVKDALEQHGFIPASAELTMIPDTTVKLEGKEAEQMLRMIERLEDLDDVQNVYANFDIDDEILDQME